MRVFLEIVLDLIHILNSNNIPWDKLSAIPEDGIADKLQKAYQSIFIDKFLMLIEYAEQVLHENYGDIKQRLLVLKAQPPKFISPKLYMAYSKLRQVMGEDDVDAVLKIMFSLNETEFQTTESTIGAGLTNALEIEIFKQEVLVSFGLDKFKAFSPNEIALSSFKESISQTLALIEAADPLSAQEIHALVSNILLVDSHSSVGATSPKFFGAVYATLPPDKLLTNKVLLLTDNLIHETSHLYLNAIMIHDPLVLNNDNELYFSPIRKNLRPMFGIYHAAFVLSRVIRVLKKILHLKLHPNYLFNERIIDKTLEVYKDSYLIISKHAKLTELGKRIHETTRLCLSMDELTV